MSWYLRINKFDEVCVITEDKVIELSYVEFKEDSFMCISRGISYEFKLADLNTKKYPTPLSKLKKEAKLDYTYLLYEIISGILETRNPILKVKKEFDLAALTAKYSYEGDLSGFVSKVVS